MKYVLIVLVLIFGFGAWAYIKGEQYNAEDADLQRLSRLVADTPEALQRQLWMFEQNGGKREDFIRHVEKIAREMNALNRNRR